MSTSAERLPPILLVAGEPRPPTPALQTPPAVPPLVPRRWQAWSPGLATTVTALTSLGVSTALALWHSDNSTAALTYGAMACMTGTVLVTHKIQTAFNSVNASTQRTLDVASEAATRAAAEVLPQITQTLAQAAAQTSREVSQSLEGASHQVSQTLDAAAAGALSALRQLAKMVGVIVGTAGALYVLGRLGAPLLLAAASGQGVGVLAGVLGAWSLAMVAVGWWAPRMLL